MEALLIYLRPVIVGVAVGLGVLFVLPHAISYTVLPQLTDPYPPAPAGMRPWINAFWIVTWVIAIVAGTLVGRSVRRAQVRVWFGNFCVRCGYDLTGNTSGRCPECGADIAGIGKRDATPSPERGDRP